MGRRGIMSAQMKEEIAKELGFYDTVQQEGWGGIKARDAGNMVKRAIEMAEESMKKSESRPGLLFCFNAVLFPASGDWKA